MSSRKKTRSILNQAVADLSTAVSIFHQIHWYMRGRGFYRFHPTMDKFMSELSAHLDAMSERLITLGGAPFSTLKEFSEHSKLEEVTGSYNRTMEENLDRVVSVYRYLVTLYQQGIDITNEEDDSPSNDLFTDAQAEAEKTIWMLEAERNQAPGLHYE